mmetsp:Transcript_15819/g.36348  ORF Transcript_15819/g.36348 Transcript_15819/m.36348 type:complete len:170 (-) Transcript_15819:131-640(-)
MHKRPRNKMNYIRIYDRPPSFLTTPLSASPFGVPSLMTTHKHFCCGIFLGSMRHQRYSTAAYVAGFGQWPKREVFDLDTKRWVALPLMTMVRGGCTAVTLTCKIFVLGNGDIGRAAEAEVFDTETLIWTSLRPMRSQRQYCAAAVVGNRVMVAQVVTITTTTTITRPSP